MKPNPRWNPVRPEEKEMIRELVKTHTQVDVARIIGRSITTVDEVLNGHKRKYTPDGFFSWKQYPGKNIII